MSTDNPNITDQDLQTINEKVRETLEEEKKLPLKVSVMGQTGVGKSSLINALFNTHLKTDPVRPCTKEIEQISIRGSSGHELWFYDLPGLGESDKVDAQYLDNYREMLEESDIVLWAIHADNRSVTFDLDALKKILEPFEETRKGELMSKVTFVLTKADLLIPPSWILYKTGNNGAFAPRPQTRAILKQKELYFQEAFYQPFEKLITARTYHGGDFDLETDVLHYDKFNVYYQGFLSETETDEMKKRYPGHDDVFDRLYDGNRVISCSSLFKFNLTLLMRIIVDKLGTLAIARFSNFYNSSITNEMLFSEAKKYCNLIILDYDKGKEVFDLAKQRI